MLLAVSVKRLPWYPTPHAQRLTVSHPLAQVQVVLENSIRSYKDRHPDASEPEVIRHVIKHDVPHTLPGSPSWHRHRLLDLLALVDADGIPTLFLTLTADEVSETRWPEIDGLEGVLSE